MDGKNRHNSSVCCQELTVDRQAYPAFLKMVVLNWYDGPSSGVVVCDKCLAEYSFFTLDWNDDRTIRAYALRLASSGTIGHISELVGEVPSWPIWFPSRIRFPKQEEHSLLNQLEGLLMIDRQPELVLGWSVRDSVPLTARRLPLSVVDCAVDLLKSEMALSRYDWLNYLGLGSL